MVFNKSEGNKLEQNQRNLSVKRLSCLMCDINSDYTPSDFLQKLSIKPQTHEQPENLQLSHQSRLTYGLKFPQSPKAESIKRIQFKHLSPRRSQKVISTRQQIPKKQTDIPAVKVFKTDSPVKNSLNPQRMVVANELDKVSRTNLKISTSVGHTVKKTSNLNESRHDRNLNTNQEIEEIVKSPYKQEKTSNEKELIAKKTQMILEVLLRNKIDNFEIEKINSILNQGLKSPEIFDKIMESSVKGQQRSLESSGNKTNQREFVKYRSSSLESIKLKEQTELKRVKSEQRGNIRQITKKQKKALHNEVKGQLLKQVRKIKQLIIVNEKGLKLSKKVSQK